MLSLYEIIKEMMILKHKNKKQNCIEKDKKDQQIKKKNLIQKKKKKFILKYMKNQKINY